MAWKLANTWQRLSLVQSLASGATTAFVSAADAALLPVLGVGDQAPAVLFDSTNREIVYITAVSGNQLTITRAQESTSARDWPAGTILVHTPTAAVLQMVINATTSAASFIGTATNVGNDYTVDVGAGNVIPSLVDGERVSFIIPAENTDAITLVVTNGSVSTASRPIRFQNNQPLRAGEFLSGWLAEVRYEAANSAWALVTNTTLQQDLEEINEGPVPGVNRHPNGRVDVWNNGTSFATPATGTETADGWYVEYDGTIGSFTVNRQAFTLGQTTVPNDPRWFIRWDQSAAGSGSTLRRFRIPMPGVHWRGGEQVTRTVWLKADASRSITAKILQNFGTGGVPSAEVEASSTVFAVTTAWQQFTVTATLPSISGKTIGSNLDDALILTLDLPVNVTLTVDVALDDFRPGHIVGAQSDTWPLGTKWGGTGRSDATFAELVTAIEAAGGPWLTQTEFDTGNPDLAAIEALAGTSGLLAKTAANSWALRNLAVGSGLLVTNPAGVAGNPTVSLDTALSNYIADPLSVSELASITGNFGTAAFVADNTLVHLAGVETITANKNFRGAVDAALVTYENTTTTHELEVRFASAGTLAELTPSPSGTPDNTKGFGYDFTNSRWFCDTILLLSGALYASTGAAATPSIAHQTDTNTGIYWGNDDTLRCVAGGTEQARFTTTGFSIIPSAAKLTLGDANNAATPALNFANDTNSGLYRIGADNLGLALNGTLQVDFSTSRILLSSGIDIQINAATTPGSVTSLGFRGVPSNSGEKSANFTGVAVDAGGAVPFTAAAQYTIPANSSVAHPLGTTIMLPSLNGGGNLTVHPDTGVTLRRGDGVAGTGDRTVPADAMAMIWKRGTNEWYIYGTFT